MNKYTSLNSFRFLVLLTLICGLIGLFLKYSGTASSQSRGKYPQVQTQKIIPSRPRKVVPTQGAILAPEADGDLDAAFGTGDASVPAGVARTFFGATSSSSSDGVSALGIQSNGKIVAGGTTSSAPSVFALVRYNANGTLDTTFGSEGTGKITTAFAGISQLSDLAIGPGDKIAAVGITSGTHSCSSADDDFAIAVYDSGGNLDPGFNITGKRTIDFFGCNDQALGVVFQPDGKIVVMGFTVQDVGPDENFFLTLVRFNTDGSFDGTFNGDGDADGIVKTPIVFTNGVGIGTKIARIASGADAGKFIVAAQGSSAVGGNDFEVERFNSNGSLDTTFGPANTGFVLTDITPNGSSDSPRALALQPDGKIILTGDSNSDFATVRYDSDGVLDPGFGTGGKVKTDFSGNSDSAKFVGIASNGKIILSGSSSGNLLNNVAIARYSSTGVIDNGFGPSGNGKILTHLGQNAGTDNSVLPTTGLLQPDGKILVGGAINTSEGSDQDFFIARLNDFFLTAAGLSISGTVITSDGRGLRNASVVLTDSQGVSRTVVTSSSGYYQLDDVQSGQNYVIGVVSKRYRFASRVLQVIDTITDVNFVGDE